MTKKQKAALAVAALEKEYPDALCSLEEKEPYRLLIAVRLSAQCTDARVNLVTPVLFERFPTLESLAFADVAEVEEIVHPCGFFRAKANDIVSMSRMLIEKYDSKHINGIIGLASDLVKYDKKYEGVILNLLGRTVVVDNMQNAINLAKENNYSFRIITIEGDVINPSGAITGGSVAKKTVNILGRSREIESLEKEIKKLKEKIQKLEKEKE